ncbi:Putative metal-dependent hydrolase YfiT [Luteitalea pratensis]|uniref:Metal-dependent hydrolase YfiT n=1 Tax=Luteitalea pratensis TaxID=1855912 RepID=A0A143PGX6_LUTPR|nr:DinB family protein [Luteitalea pratensis]AMY07785.1 Putative metal-dependent hydrolase YfiT [Luteitalea pratensis]
MPETAQQYIQRILSHAEGLDGLTLLAETPSRLESLLRATSADRWRTRPAPERWSAGEVLAHLADSEIVTGWRVRSILATDGVPLQPFDQDVWAEAFRYGEIDPAESLATFSAARASLLSLLRRVDPSRRQHHGLHAERGKEFIEHLIQLYAGHDLNHLKQIEALVAS